MKLKAIFPIVGAILLLCAGVLSSDELSDLKTQVSQLEQKVEKLESKQQEQAKEIEKVPEVTESVEQLKTQPSAAEVVANAIGKQTNIGGHLKFFLADQSIGKLNEERQHNSFSMGISNFWIYLNKNVTDWLQLTVAPEIMVMAEATPTLKNNITRSGSANIEIDFDEAYMTARLPHEFELKAGAIYPLFIEEYGNKSWWHEQYNANTGLVTLEAWKSMGLELYRNFNFENFSLPVYLSLLNGEDRGIIQDSRFTDNNSAKNVLLHVAPEFFAFDSRFRFMGSLGGGRWDDDGEKDAFQWAAGTEITYSDYSFSGEYIYRRRQDLPLTGGGMEDGTDKGYYLKAKYTLDPKWRFLVKYSDVDLWAASGNSLKTDNYKSVSGAVGFWLTESSTIIPQVEYVDAKRKDDTDTLKYWRYTLGWRTTF